MDGWNLTTKEKLLDVKMGFHFKFKSHSSLKRQKVHLVVLGKNKQGEGGGGGVNYTEIFAISWKWLQ